MKRNKLLDSCLNGEGDLFKEIKAMRKCKSIVASSMDGITDDVKGHFKQKVEKLFNSADDKHAVLELQKEIDARVDETSLEDVLKVTPEIVKEASHKLKTGKGDPVFSFSSDCLKNATQSVYDDLSIISQSFLVHGHLG